MRVAVVTGASTGFGKAIALELAARGAVVYAGVRREEDGTKLEDAYKVPAQVCAHVYTYIDAHVCAHVYTRRIAKIGQARP